MDRANEPAPSPRTCSFCRRTFPAEVAGVFTAPDGLSTCEECVEFLSQGLDAQRELEADQPEDRGAAAAVGIPLIAR